MEDPLSQRVKNGIRTIDSTDQIIGDQMSVQGAVNACEGNTGDIQAVRYRGIADRIVVDDDLAVSNDREEITGVRTRCFDIPDDVILDMGIIVRLRTHLNAVEIAEVRIILPGTATAERL